MATSATYTPKRAHSNKSRLNFAQTKIDDLMRRFSIDRDKAKMLLFAIDRKAFGIDISIATNGGISVDQLETIKLPRIIVGRLLQSSHKNAEASVDNELKNYILNETDVKESIIGAENQKTGLLKNIIIGLIGAIVGGILTFYV
ncbi:hypothetical protein GCM10028805_48090 [Spirosoma harenae]